MLRRVHVLQLARLMGLAPFRKEVAYFPSLPWRIYSCLVLGVLNATVIYTCRNVWLFLELAVLFSVMSNSLAVIMKVYCCAAVLSLLVFSWGCVSRLHAALPGLLTRLPDTACPPREAALLLLSAAFLGYEVFNLIDQRLEVSLGLGLLRFFALALLPVTVVLFSLLLQSVARQYELINLRAQKLLLGKQALRGDPASEEVLLLRACHAEASDTLRALGTCFGTQMLVLLAFSVNSIASSLLEVLGKVFATPSQVSADTMKQTVAMAITCAQAFTFVFSCEEVAEEGNRLRELLRTLLRHGDPDKEEYGHIQRFASFLNNHRVGVTLTCIGVVKYSLILTILSTAATYITILTSFVIT